LNNAIAEKDGLKIDFNVSEFSSWSSIKSKIANRENLGINNVEVETITLNSIFDKYGVPYYCKIDIEGYDEVCLESLKNYHEYTTFITVES
jgi:FkbM family methyltransferase